MNSRELVRNYFDREAARFDAIYEREKPFLQQLGDRLFRGVILERFRLICALAPQPGPWSVLDVGCGSGRYALALARAGATRVTGVDVSAPMIELARQAAEAAGIAARCAFHVSSFEAFPEKGAHDVVVATGYFDYLEQPSADLAKMLKLCRGRVYASFPKRFELRAPARKLRFWLRGGFVRFYSRSEVEGLFADAGVPAERLALFDLGRDYLAVARPA